ncbi:hypothetical protein IF2G_07501 [Cordyceps javanica]|nr:hypothetical protein IF2G_07501 [Cordyceps javanica]
MHRETRLSADRPGRTTADETTHTRSKEKNSPNRASARHPARIGLGGPALLCKLSETQKVRVKEGQQSLNHPSPAEVTRRSVSRRDGNKMLPEKGYGQRRLWWRSSFSRATKPRVLGRHDMVRLAGQYQPRYG